jgi:hypothetical protein
MVMPLKMDALIVIITQRVKVVPAGTIYFHISIG